ncbi:MBL fold metallo-hydrolase [Hymenobacter elongatus]|uniref:Metallo-beta-lactamase domain-containing protein n=1 Tax=Hymenobacter elongatus TaxID=877208 RepID=A0A4Z0PP09_9BACT|nr:hypothetical protein [Hymenobacter elongatus]TGE18056.1 hypothetical protein E5J99_05840 [Hymenobacter elongatus]
MQIPSKLVCLCVLLWLPIWVCAAPTNYLQQCWRKQGQALQGGYVSFSFQEKANELEHSLYPWQQTSYAKQGSVAMNAENFLKHDSLTQGSRTLSSKTQLSPSELLFLDYGDKDLFAVTPDLFAGQLVHSARYSPLLLLHYFVRQQVAATAPAATEFAVYQTQVQGSRVTLFIRKASQLLDRAEILSHDDLFGDVLTTCTYGNYESIGKVSVPTTVAISKLNGKLQDAVLISGLRVVAQSAPLLQRPAGYQMPAPPAAPAPVVQHYRPNIHLLELKHTDDRVMVVEFQDFLLVAEAPLNSQNGESILAAARQIAPGKPVRYFVFGHYHPHYLGGLRPFVQQGATVLCGPGDEAYVRYLAAAPHTLRPDSQQRAPRPLQLEEIATSKTITDGQFTMQIYFIGNASAHTNDYLIYYFPSEKLLFEDDLVWIKREGGSKKASARQAGLYKAVKALNLDVETVIQSWPVADYGVKTIIPFADIEQSMQVK